MIRYKETYERWTSEDYELGECNDIGFAHTPDTPLEANFREMVKLLRFCEYESGWFTHYNYNNGTPEFYEEGIDEHRSYTPKTNRDLRYMLKAWRVNNTAEG